jgi:hypothetical protein
MHFIDCLKKVKRLLSKKCQTSLFIVTTKEKRIGIVTIIVKPGPFTRLQQERFFLITLPLGRLNQLLHAPNLLKDSVHDLLARAREETIVYLFSLLRM